MDIYCEEIPNQYSFALMPYIISFLWTLDIIQAIKSVKSWPLLSIFFYFYFLNLTLIPCTEVTNSKPSKNNFVNNSIIPLNPYRRTWLYGIAVSTSESKSSNPSSSLGRAFASNVIT